MLEKRVGKWEIIRTRRRVKPQMRCKNKEVGDLDKKKKNYGNEKRHWTDINGKEWMNV